MPHLFRKNYFILLVASGLCGGCSVYLPETKVEGQRDPLRRSLLIESIPSIVPGGTVLQLQFKDLTSASLNSVVPNNQFIRYSVDGGRNFVTVGPRSFLQPEMRWTAPYVDTKNARLELVASSGSRIDVLMQSRVFEIRSSGPALSQDLLPYYHTSNTDQVTYGGTCESQFPVTISLIPTSGEATVLGTVTCQNGRWSFPVTATVDGESEYQFYAQDSVNNSTTLRVKWRRDTVPPVIAPNTLQLAGGAASVITNYIPVSLDASDVHSHVTHFCLRYALGAEVISGPDAACWVAVNDPDQPRLVPQNTLTLRDFLYRIGYVMGTYRVVTFARDAAGNVSLPQEKSIHYDPGIPPVVVNVMASKTDPPTLPLPTADITVPLGTPVVIRWKVTHAHNGLGPTPISLYSTSDDRTFTPIAQSLSNGANGGCSLGSGLSTGCYVWTSALPTDTYFRIRVAVQDLNGMITTSSTNPLNGNGLSSIAGNTDAGVGASAQAAMFIGPKLGYLSSDAGSFVVSNRGNVFFRDPEKGILWMQPRDAIVRVLMPRNSAASNTYEGSIVSGLPSVRAPIKMALDYNNGLLVWDYDRIRRIDLNSMTITTVIGGGSSNLDNVGPLEVKFSALGGADSSSPLLLFVPLPDGRIVFESDYYGSLASRLRVYSPFTNKVTSIDVSGRGHGVGFESTGYETEELKACFTVRLGINTPCAFQGFGLEYNPDSYELTTLLVTVVHSLVGGAAYPMANLIPSLEQVVLPGEVIGQSKGPHPPPEGDMTRIIGRNGRLYAVNRGSGRISRYNKASASWERIVGTNAVGDCADGTAALSCAIRPTDAFVDAQGNLFFLDSGRIRTVDGAQKVVTVYGQSFFFGDGGLAISARFSVVPTLDRANDGEVVVLDSGESRLRVFSPGGNIQTIAGNSVLAIPALDQPASTQSFSIAGAGREFTVFSIDRISKDVFTSRGSSVARLTRATDRWSIVSSALGGIYPPNVVGFDGQKLLVHSNGYDSSIGTFSNSLLRHLAQDPFASPPTLTDFAGVPGAAAGSFCADGGAVATCSVPWAYDNRVSKSVYDPANQRWLVLATGTGKVKVMPTAPGALTSSIVLTHPASSFAYRSDANGDTIYYCANGRVYQKVVGGSGLDTMLPWRIPSMACTGMSMVYHEQTQSIVFPYLQTGLYGVGEYKIP